MMTPNRAGGVQRAVEVSRAVPRFARWLMCSALALTLTTLTGCASTLSASKPSVPVIGREQVSATLWMQRAAEYRIASEQVYRLATERLATTIAAPGTAAIEQQSLSPSELSALPTAIIVDLDETVLDNSFYQARRALVGGEYDEASWQAWMQEASAPALPGAVEFLQAAARAGHKIVYVTNRECRRLEALPDDPCPARTATLRNLEALQLPNANAPDALSLRLERPEWASSDKTLRRAWIATSHRIVALVGDDLRDFVDRPVYEARRGELAERFGSRWFLLPNPIYGSWERAITAGACDPGMSAETCAAAATARRYAALEAEPAPSP
jgi:acid phosphatase